ncbi:hypothetical protein ATANTOWER_016827, partial [Ataeniobius toweri]|nr:hypothetical protein [Ataeniobius toweri]
MGSVRNWAVRGNLFKNYWLSSNRPLRHPQLNKPAQAAIATANKGWPELNHNSQTWLTFDALCKIYVNEHDFALIVPCPADKSSGIFLELMTKLTCVIISTGDSPEDFGRTTLANVSAKDSFLWLHSVFALVYFIITLLSMAHHSARLEHREDEK